MTQEESVSLLFGLHLLCDQEDDVFELYNLIQGMEKTNNDHFVVDIPETINIYDNDSNTSFNASSSCKEVVVAEEVIQMDDHEKSTMNNIDSIITPNEGIDNTTNIARKNYNVNSSIGKVPTIQDELLGHLDHPTSSNHEQDHYFEISESFLFNPLETDVTCNSRPERCLTDETIEHHDNGDDDHYQQQKRIPSKEETDDDDEEITISNNHTSPNSNNNNNYDVSQYCLIDGSVRFQYVFYALMIWMIGQNIANTAIPGILEHMRIWEQHFVKNTCSTHPSSSSPNHNNDNKNTGFFFSKKRAGLFQFINYEKSMVSEEKIMVNKKKNVGTKSCNTDPAFIIDDPKADTTWSTNHNIVQQDQIVIVSSGKDGNDGSIINPLISLSSSSSSSSRSSSSSCSSGSSTSRHERKFHNLIRNRIGSIDSDNVDPMGYIKDKIQESSPSFLYSNHHNGQKDTDDNKLHMQGRDENNNTRGYGTSRATSVNKEGFLNRWQKLLKELALSDQPPIIIM